MFITFPLPERTEGGHLDPSNGTQRRDIKQAMFISELHHLGEN